MRRIGGVGLGLTVGRAHAALMGGHLELASSEVDQGSVFALTMGFTVAQVPLDGVGEATQLADPSTIVVSDAHDSTLSDPALADGMRMGSGHGIADGSNPPSTLLRSADKTDRGGPASGSAYVTDETRDAHVLVVEDNKLNQRVAASFLERMGCKVAVANNGKEGLDAVADHIFDVVLMDCQMPVMDGLAATRAIRALPSPVCDVPIVALTAHALPEEQTDAYAAGMDDYMTKPVNFASLRKMVTRWRGGRVVGTA